MGSSINEYPLRSSEQLVYTVSDSQRIALSSFSFSKTVADEPASIKKAYFKNRVIEQESFSPLQITEQGLRVDNTAKELGTHKKFSEAELVEHELSVDDAKNLIVGSSQEPFDTGSEEMMYVMHKNGKIYVAYPQVGVYYHSSLVPDSFDWPIAAGMLRGKKGKLMAIDEESGHFPSMDRIKLVIRSLQNAGATIAAEDVLKTKSHRTPGDKIKRASTPSPLTRLRRLEVILADKAASSIKPAPSPVLQRLSSPHSSSLTEHPPLMIRDKPSPPSLSRLSPRVRKLLTQEQGSPSIFTFIPIENHVEKSTACRKSSHDTTYLPRFKDSMHVPSEQHSRSSEGDGNSGILF